MRIVFDGEKFGFDGNAVTMLGANTGHAVTPIAFCASHEIAREISEALKLLAEAKAGKWAKVPEAA